MFIVFSHFSCAKSDPAPPPFFFFFPTFFFASPFVPYLRLYYQTVYQLMNNTEGSRRHIFKYKIVILCKLVKGPTLVICVLFPKELMI